MLVPGVSSTIGIRAKYLDRVTPSLLPARCFGYLGELEIFTSEDEGSVFLERVNVWLVAPYLLMLTPGISSTIVYNIVYQLIVWLFSFGNLRTLPK